MGYAVWGFGAMASNRLMGRGFRDEMTLMFLLEESFVCNVEKQVTTLRVELWATPFEFVGTIELSDL